MGDRKDQESHLGTRRARKQDSSRVEKNEAYKERREAILEAARELFLTKGVEDTSLMDIASSLNFDRATLYYYVSSKKEIFDAIVEKIAEKNVVEIEEIAHSDRRPSEKLSSSMMALNRSYREAYPLLQMYLNDYVSDIRRKRSKGKGADQQWSARYYQAIRSILQQGVDDGEFVLTLPVGMTALGLIGMLNWSQAVSIGSEKRLREDRLSPDGIGEGFARLIFSGIIRPRGDSEQTSDPA